METRMLCLFSELLRLLTNLFPFNLPSHRHLLNYSRDHSVQEGLDYTAAWNMVMLTSPVNLRAPLFFSLASIHFMVDLTHVYTSLEFF